MKRALATLLVATLGLPLAACGRDEGEPIPANDADALIRVLNTAKRQSDAGSCQTLLRDTIPSLHKRADDLPSSVGADVRETISDGIDRLQDLSEEQCAPEEEPQTTEETTETTEPTTTSETTTTEPTTTTEETTTETTPPDTNTETTPPDTGTTTTTPPQTIDPGDGGTPVDPGNGGGTP
jgi:hypothetical protein